MYVHRSAYLLKSKTIYVYNIFLYVLCVVCRLVLLRERERQSKQARKSLSDRTCIFIKRISCCPKVEVVCVLRLGKTLAVLYDLSQ